MELHGANGYLVHQFLGTNTNKRTDEYGGSDENRAQFLLEIIDAMAAEIGADKIGLKISPTVPFNDMEDANAKEFYPYLIEKLNEKNLAYLHVGFEETPEMNISWHQIFATAVQKRVFRQRRFYKGIGRETIKRKRRGRDCLREIIFGKSRFAEAI